MCTKTFYSITNNLPILRELRFDFAAVLSHLWSHLNFTLLPAILSLTSPSHSSTLSLAQSCYYPLK